MENLPILLVAGEKSDFDFIQGLLSEEERPGFFQVHWARSYEEGLQALMHRLYVLVLVDYDLGPHSGAAFVQSAGYHGAHTPYILFNHADDWGEDAFTCSAVRCLKKKEMTAQTLKKAIMQEVYWERVQSLIHP